MSVKCSIPRSDNKSAPTGADLSQFSNSEIIPKLDAIYNNDNYYRDGGDEMIPHKMREAMISLLQSLGQDYIASDHIYIVEALKKALNEKSNQHLKQLLPIGSLLQFMKFKGTAEEASAKIFTDSIFDDDTTDNDAVDFFLHNAFGHAIKAKQQLERKMQNTILNSFIVDRKNGVIVSNIQQANQNVLYYKKELLKDVQTFFRVHNISGSKFKDADIDNMTIEDIISNFKREISNYLSVGILSGSDLQDLYDNAYNSNINDSEKLKAKSKLDAYGAWLVLQHFDNFIKMTVGDTIIVNPYSENRYQYSSKGTNINTTWRKDDNIDLQAEINKLTQALIKTSPFLTFGTNTPVSGAYLQFSDFSYITAKIKDLVYNQEAATTILSKNVELMNYLTLEEQNLVKNKSLRQLISNSRYNPQKYIPLTYKILTFVDRTNTAFIKKFSNFNSQDRNLLWSIYKNIYEQDKNGMEGLHSLYSIQVNNPDSKNYFAAISSVADCIFSVDFVQYVFEDGVLKMKTLRDAAVDKIYKDLRNTINTKNSNDFLGQYDFSTFNVSEIKTKNKFSGITFQLQLESGEPLYIHVTNMGENIVFSKSPNDRGQALNKGDLKQLSRDSNLNTFFEEVLGINISSDKDFRTTYQEIIKEGDDLEGPYVHSLLSLSSHVFFNRYFVQNYVNKRPFKQGKIQTIKEYFTEDKGRPSFSNQFFNMEMIPKSKHTILKNLAQALGTTRGINSSRQVKDSDNAMLSSQTLSRLLGNLVSQLDIQIDSYNKVKAIQGQIEEKTNFLLANPQLNDYAKINTENDIEELNNQLQTLKEQGCLLDTDLNPAAANFSLITNPNLFKGILKAEEIKGVFGNKKQVKFTTSEAVISSFLHNFILGHCDSSILDANSELGGGIVGLLPSVNSDKTTVGVAKFNLKAGKAGNTGKAYIDLTNDELIFQIQEELGGYFRTMYKNIKDDFSKLQEFAATKENPIIIVLNPDNNFQELNDYVKEYNNRIPVGEKKLAASEVIYNLTSEYNKNNPTKPIRLVDQVHFIANDKKGIVSFNNTIKDLNLRFRDNANTKSFFNLKSTEILKSALDSNFAINIYGSANLDNQPELNYLRNGEWVRKYSGNINEQHKDWINDAGQMVLAKITIDGKDYNVSNKTDILKIEKLLTLEAMRKRGYEESDLEMHYNKYTEYFKELCGTNNLLSNIHLLRDRIQLHPMLERYALMDYLFTQQLMASTVGSHVAHPAKGNFSAFTSEEQLKKDNFYKSSEGFTTKVELTSNIQSTNNYKIGAKRIWDDTIKQNKILVDIEVLKEKYNNRTWVNPPKLYDDTYAEALPANQFKSFEEFLTFVLEHESAHITNLINIGETRGEYETRINNVALKNLQYKKEQTLLAEEASRFYAQHKRNVSFTAAMDQFQLNQIDGIPTWYNIAIIDDIKEDLFTIDGNTNDAKPFDGATFVNPFIMYLENNSLNEARAGIDKKQFVHYYDELTGTGGIIKTAGFALTNDRIRNSVFYRHMMKNMTNKVWKDYKGQDYIADITKDYKNNDVDYGTFYFKRGNKYYQATITKAEGANNYIRTEIEIDKTGAIIGEKYNNIPFNNVNTNYKLWEMFGGMHSQDFNGGVLQPSESSMKNVVKAIINTGEVKPSYTGGITAEHIDQPLKNADIHYAPTIGAVKQGAANINPNKCYYGEQNLNFFKIRMTNAGIQLDKEHNADNSKLSLMTQVISSACSMGFNPEQANRLYNALYNLTLHGIKEFREGFLEILNSDNPEKFEIAIADCMIKNMLTSTAQDGDMLRAIAQDLINEARKGKNLTFADTKTFPYSDPTVFDKLVTNLSVIMTKSGIKAQMDGILSVLCPTQNIVKTYNFVDPNTKVRHTYTLSQLEEHFGKDYDNLIWDLQKLQKGWENISTDFDTTNIEIGTKYLVTTADGRTVLMDIKFPHSHYTAKGERKTPLQNSPIQEYVIGYQEFKNQIRSGQIKNIVEWVVDGKELGSINYKFKGTDGKNYQVWDIDYIQDLFQVMIIAKSKTDAECLELYRNLIAKYDGGLNNFDVAVSKHFLSYKNKGNVSNKHLLKLAKLYAKQLQQNILFSLSKNNPNKINSFKIEGREVTIDKNSIQVQPYEIVMPKIFLSEFGLDEYTNLDEVIKNPNYFYDKILQNFNTKIQNELFYDIELKNVNGNHIYIKDRAGMQAGWEQDLEKVIIHKKVDELGRIWRVDLSTNKKMYQLFKDTDEIYRIPGTNTEIIVTSQKFTEDTRESGFTFYLNNFKYHSLHISEAIAAGTNTDYANRPQFDDILEDIKESKNRSAQAWLRVFKEGEHWVGNRVQLNQELNDYEQLGESFKNHLKEQATIIHTSLLKSLDIIAARIPAQNQQSFMPMKVVAWENPNVNTAYVSVMQFFLQGSDLDIDAVSLLTHSFSKNGEFIAWSPDFDMSDVDMLNLSMELPFPTGNKLQKVVQENVDTIYKQPNLLENEHYKKLIECENAIKNLPHLITNGDPLIEAQLQQTEKALKRQALKHYINLLKFIESHKGQIYFENISDQNDDQVKAIIERIDKHNTYLDGLNDNIVSGAIKNYVVGSLYSISTDAANLLEAHTGVDVATGPLKKIANESELSEVQKTFTPGNPLNKYQAIEEASVGKDDIAICATGLKAFFASTFFCNDYMNQNLQDSNLSEYQIKNLFKLIQFNPVTIGGRTFQALANIRVDDLSKLEKSVQVYDILKDRGFDEDASIIMSALLSLSTDNAKELCLAKINAGTGMIGMYLYGAAIGMDFEVMNKIIASPLGFTVAKLLNSNEFTMHRGKTSVDAAISYLYDGPQLADLQRFNGVAHNKDKKITTQSVFDLFTESINTILKQDSTFKQEAGELMESKGSEDFELNIYNIGKFLSRYTREHGSIKALTFLHKVRNIVNTTIANYEGNFTDQPTVLNNYKALNNQLIDFLNEFVGQAETLKDAQYQTDYGQSNLVYDLSMLALGADEFKRLGQFLRLNQEIKTKSDEFITFVQKIESSITERYGLISRVNQRFGNKMDRLKLAPFDFKLFAESFLQDPDNPEAYHNRQIEIYEQYCKTCINPLRVLTQVPHYRGYLESMILAYQGDYRKSSKFRAIKHLGNKFISDNKVKSSIEKTAVYKGVQNFVNDYINNAYLSSIQPIELPKSTDQRKVVTIDSLGKKHDVEKRTYLPLGISEAGNRTFEHFFETVFVPTLKKEFKGEQNLFIEGLQDVLITDNTTGIRVLAKSLPINMMPSSDNERILLNKYVNDFTKISGRTIKIGGIDYSITQMFQIYNLLKFKGKTGKNSLAPIFKDIAARNDYLKEYRTFINTFDSTYDFRLGDSDVDPSKTIIEVEEEVVYKYLAPLTSINTATSNVIKYKDLNTGEIVLLQYPEESNSDYRSEELGEDNYYEEVFDQDGNEEFEQDASLDEFFGNGIHYDPDNYKPDYGGYELYKGKGVLTRFNNYKHQVYSTNMSLNSYSYNGTTISDIVISDGIIKQFTLNGEIKKPDTRKKIITIEIDPKTGNETYNLNQDTLNNIINYLNCG